MKIDAIKIAGDFCCPEREGFEPPEDCSSIVFKTTSIDRSDIAPKDVLSAYQIIAFYVKYGICDCTELVDLYIIEYIYGMRKTDFMLGALLALVALMMIIAPEQCIKVAVIALGIEAVINGLFNLIKIRQLVDDKSFQLTVLVRSLISIVIGILAIVLPLRFAEAMWTIMLYVLVAYLLASAFLELYMLAKLRDTNIERRRYMLEVIISFVGAIVLFIVPQQIGLVLVRILGVLLLAVSAGYILFEWHDRPIVVDEVEVVDDVQPPVSDSLPTGDAESRRTEK